MHGLNLTTWDSCTCIIARVRSEILTENMILYNSIKFYLMLPKNTDELTEFY